MKAQLISENINFKRGVDSKEALGVGSLAVRVVKELQSRDAYTGAKFEIDHFGDEITITIWNKDFSVQKGGQEIITPVDIRQIIYLEDPNYIEYICSFNYAGQVNADPEDWSRDSGPDPEGIVDDAEINMMNGEFGMEDRILFPDKTNESQEFKRGINTKDALDVGFKYRIGLHDGSYMYDQYTYRGSLEDAQKDAAERMVRQWDYSRRPEKKEDYWATFSTWKNKYRNEGRFYKKSDGSIGQHEKWVGGWDEDFDSRIRLKDVDVTKLRFDDEFIHDSKNRN